MKQILVLAFFLSGLSSQSQKSLSLCNTSIKSVTIDGEISTIDGHLDFRKACLRLTGTTYLCDKEDKVIVSNMTITLESSGCKGQEAKVEDENPYNYTLEGSFTILDEESDPIFGSTYLKSGNFDDNLNLSELNLPYPNPATGIFYLKNHNKSISDIRIFNLNGQSINSASIIKDSGVIEIDLSKLSAGIYFLKYKDRESGIQYSQKLIKK